MTLEVLKSTKASKVASPPLRGSTGKVRYATRIQCQKYNSILKIV